MLTMCSGCSSGWPYFLPPISVQPSGVPIVKLPGPTTTISGQSAQSRNSDFGAPSASAASALKVGANTYPAANTGKPNAARAAPNFFCIASSVAVLKEDGLLKNLIDSRHAYSDIIRPI